jgi:hypothetical protein
MMSASKVAQDREHAAAAYVACVNAPHLNPPAPYPDSLSEEIPTCVMRETFDWSPSMVDNSQSSPNQAYWLLASFSPQAGAYGGNIAYQSAYTAGFPATVSLTSAGKVAYSTGLAFRNFERYRTIAMSIQVMPQLSMTNQAGVVRFARFGPDTFTRNVFTAGSQDPDTSLTPISPDDLASYAGCVTWPLADLASCRDNYVTWRPCTYNSNVDNNNSTQVNGLDFRRPQDDTTNWGNQILVSIAGAAAGKPVVFRVTKVYQFIPMPGVSQLLNPVHTPENISMVGAMEEVLEDFAGVDPDLATSGALIHQASLEVKESSVSDGEAATAYAATASSVHSEGSELASDVYYAARDAWRGFQQGGLIGAAGAVIDSLF